jgi:NDP-sugar pyrophosphorylase family protein
MVLAAGLGTRLRPLTNDRPKALVEVGGRTLLEITLTRLREFGIRDVIINLHHFADMVASYLKSNDNFGMRIEISREETLLDTGGGLKKAGWFFVKNSDDKGAGREQPFVLHNVDVISNIDFGQMLKCHEENKALATLALQNRETSRYLLFDQSTQLCGRRSGRDGKSELVRPVENPQPLAFSGIHIISSRLIPMMTEQGAFSIIDTYLRLAKQGEKILGFRADQYYWRDLGRVEHIAQAEQEMRHALKTTDDKK